MMLNKLELISENSKLIIN